MCASPDYTSVFTLESVRYASRRKLEFRSLNLKRNVWQNLVDPCVKYWLDERCCLCCWRKQWLLCFSCSNNQIVEGNLIVKLGIGRGRREHWSSVCFNFSLSPLTPSTNSVVLSGRIVLFSFDGFSSLLEMSKEGKLLRVELAYQ